MFVKPGDRVTKGQKILTLHTDESDRFERAREALEGTLTIGEGQVAPRESVVLDRIAR